MHDWVENVTPLTLPRYYLRPDSAIDGPSERVLRLWDLLNMRRRVAGIGALDAHAVKLAWGVFNAFPYEFLFRTILTHAFVEDWGASPEEDAGRLRAAFRLARAFVGYDVHEPSDGFNFFADGGILMGERGSFKGAGDLRVTLPREAEVTLVHNGRCAASVSGRECAFAVEEPGVYRVEARLGGRP